MLSMVLVIYWKRGPARASVILTRDGDFAEVVPGSPKEKPWFSPRGEDKVDTKAAGSSRICQGLDKERKEVLSPAFSFVLPGRSACAKFSNLHHSAGLQKEKLSRKIKIGEEVKEK